MNVTTGFLFLRRHSQSSYRQGSSSRTLMHISQVKMSALLHIFWSGNVIHKCSDKRNYTVLGLATLSTVKVATRTVINFGKTQKVLLYSSPNDDIAHIAVQLQHNERFSKCVLLYWLYKLYCSRPLEEVHRGNGCTYRICTEMVLEWHCLLNSVVCSAAIDCCSTGATVVLSAVQYSDRLLFNRCYSGTVCCAVQR